jgi:signal peptidase I
MNKSTAKTEQMAYLIPKLESARIRTLCLLLSCRRRKSMLPFCIRTYGREFMEAEERQVEFRKTTTREYFESIVITAIIALFVTTFVVQAFKIPTGSMESNLLIGDHLLVNKFIYGLHSSFLSNFLPFKGPQRGDVIVFKYPSNPEVAYVKRLIGMPGDTIEMVGRTVFVNNKALKEDYTQYIDPNSIYEHFGPVKIPPESYFAMGDNRDNSQDSRFWGFVPRSHILGRALVIYWSYETPRDEYLQTGVDDRLKQFADVFLNFFTKTRWNRTFRIIR